MLKPVDGDEMVQGVRNLARRIVRGGRARNEANVKRSDWFFDPAYWALQTPDGDRSLEALIRRLGRKIEASGAARAPIQTMRGKGYLFSARVRMGRRSGPGARGLPGVIAHAKSK